MRTVAFFVSLCFYLLSGGNNLHAGTSHARFSHSSASNPAYGTQEILKKADHTIIIIDDADFDLDEEYFSSSNAKEGSSNKIFAGKYLLLKSRYSTKVPQYILNRSDNFFKISQAFCGNSSPIYIKNRSLRI